MHSLESFLSASELREETALPDVHRPSSLRHLPLEVERDIFNTAFGAAWGLGVEEYHELPSVSQVPGEARRIAICKVLIGGLQCKSTQLLSRPQIAELICRYSAKSMSVELDDPNRAASYILFVWFLDAGRFRSGFYSASDSYMSTEDTLWTGTSAVYSLDRP
ncbi:hypothetical protein AKJ16_DCAP03653 [Drosera capensis]